MSTPEGQIFQNHDQSMSRPTSELNCAPCKLTELHLSALILNTAAALSQLPVRARTTLLAPQCTIPSAQALDKFLSPILERPLPPGVTLHIGTPEPSLTSQGECFIEVLLLPAEQQPHHSNPSLTRTGKSLHSLAGLHIHGSVPTNLPSRPC